MRGEVKFKHVQHTWVELQMVMKLTVAIIIVSQSLKKFKSASGPTLHDQLESDISNPYTGKL